MPTLLTNPRVSTKAKDTDMPISRKGAAGVKALDSQGGGKLGDVEK
jgi:hypothetical protein